jgi:hypothetical protein
MAAGARCDTQSTDEDRSWTPSQYKLQKDLLIVLLAPEILSDLKALAKKRKQCVDGLVEQIIEAYLVSQHQLSRGPAMTEEAWKEFKECYRQ